MGTLLLSYIIEVETPHHYEYWIHSLDEGGIPAEMPRKYLLELICDFLSACRTYGGNPKDEYDWWIKNSPGMKIHPKTKHFIKEVFWQLHCHVDDIPLKDAIRLADNEVNKYDIFL